MQGDDGLTGLSLRGCALPKISLLSKKSELTTRIAVEVGRFTDMASSGNFYFHNTESHYCLQPT